MANTIVLVGSRFNSHDTLGSFKAIACNDHPENERERLYSLLQPQNVICN